MSQVARLEALVGKEEMELAVLEDAFLASKEVGLARVAEEKADAFKAAKSAEEYEALVAQIEPANTNDEKLSLREARQYYRDNHRKPKTAGAQPATIGVTAAPGEI